MNDIKSQEIRIAFQRKAIFECQNAMEVMRPCRLEDGIVQLNPEERAAYVQKFSSLDADLTMFIPASGSGSRMFQFLYDFLENPTEENRQQTERFFSQITSFALFKKLPTEIQEKVQLFQMNVVELIHFLLEKEGMNFGQYPKGLIPFHFNTPFILNPFQEQLIQGSELTNHPISFHFTIQSIFEKEFQSAIQLLKEITGNHYLVAYSEQDSSTDSFLFLDDQTILRDDESRPIMRPAGHGTLLKNLENMDADYVLVKNIDNLQHFTKSKQTRIEWQLLIAMIDDLKQEFNRQYVSPNFDRLKELNDRFQWLSSEELQSINTPELIRAFVNKPLRVCGMVRNEGQPGGGPFFVRKNGKIKKQIVEKIQLAHLPNGADLMMKSTHFNPVMMVLSMKDMEGNKFQLSDFKDNDGYFILEKTVCGKHVKFLENPGLWNGGMYEWNTVFVEIPNEVFTPVKTVLDLLHHAHSEG